MACLCRNCRLTSAFTDISQSGYPATAVFAAPPGLRVDADYRSLIYERNLMRRPDYVLVPS
jgi:hypothetical protein